MTKYKFTTNAAQIIARFMPGEKPEFFRLYNKHVCAAFGLKRGDPIA